MTSATRPMPTSAPPAVTAGKTHFGRDVLPSSAASAGTFSRSFFHAGPSFLSSGSSLGPSSRANATLLFQAARRASSTGARPLRGRRVSSMSPVIGVVGAGGAEGDAAAFGGTEPKGVSPGGGQTTAAISGSGGGTPSGGSGCAGGATEAESPNGPRAAPCPAAGAGVSLGAEGGTYAGARASVGMSPGSGSGPYVAGTGDCAGGGVGEGPCGAALAGPAIDGAFAGAAGGCAFAAAGGGCAFAEAAGRRALEPGLGGALPMKSSFGAGVAFGSSGMPSSERCAAGAGAGFADAVDFGTGGFTDGARGEACIPPDGRVTTGGPLPSGGSSMSTEPLSSSAADASASPVASGRSIELLISSIASRVGGMGPPPRWVAWPFGTGGGTLRDAEVRGETGDAADFAFALRFAPALPSGLVLAVARGTAERAAAPAAGLGAGACGAGVPRASTASASAGESALTSMAVGRWSSSSSFGANWRVISRSLGLSS